MDSGAESYSENFFPVDAERKGPAKAVAWVPTEKGWARRNGKPAKNNSVKFIPSKAYLMTGHGISVKTNVEPTFIVPANTIIVVKALRGELMTAYMDDHPTLRSFKSIICNLDKKIVKDPLSYPGELIQRFGDLAVYKPGDRCPDFEYSLAHCFKTQPADPTYGSCRNMGSGVLDLDKISDCTLDFYESLNDGPTKTIEEIRQFVATMFKNSAYPTSAEVLKEMNDKFMNKICHSIEKKDGKIQLKTAEEKNSDILEALKETLLKTTQEKLCKKLGPGVYYHSICRPAAMLSAITKIVHPTVNTKNREYFVREDWSGYHRPRLGKEQLMPYLKEKNANGRPVPNPEYFYKSKLGTADEKTYSYNNPSVKALLEQKIMEAEQYRKPFLHSYYTSNQFPKNAAAEAAGRAAAGPEPAQAEWVSAEERLALPKERTFPRLMAELRRNEAERIKEDAEALYPNDPVARAAAIKRYTNIVSRIGVIPPRPAYTKKGGRRRKARKTRKLKH